MRRVILSIALVSLATGCTRIPPVTPYAPNAGVTLCKDLNHGSNDRATEEFMVGAVAAASGLVLAGAGLVLSSGSSSNAPWYEKSQGLFFVTPGAILTGYGVAAMVASGNTDRLAKQTSDAVTRRPFDDRAAYYECVAARSGWSGDVSGITRLQLELLDENRLASAMAREDAKTAKTEAEKAGEAAIDARQTAVKAIGAAASAYGTAQTSANATRDLAAGAEKLSSSVTPKKDGVQELESARASISEVRKTLEQGAVRAPSDARPSPKLSR